VRERLFDVGEALRNAGNVQSQAQLALQPRRRDQAAHDAPAGLRRGFVDETCALA